MAPYQPKRCELCIFSSPSIQLLRRHIARNHICYFCDRQVVNLRIHQPCYPRQIGAGQSVIHSGHQFRMTESALNFTFVNFHHTIPAAVRLTTIEAVFRTYESDMTRLIRNLLEKFRSINALVNLEVLLINNFTRETAKFFLSADLSTITNPRLIKRFLFNNANAMINELNVFTLKGMCE
jgi:hypothetical protein